jgi:hypothetical protein
MKATQDNDTVQWVTQVVVVVIIIIKENVHKNKREIGPTACNEARSDATPMSHDTNCYHVRGYIRSLHTCVVVA